MKQLCNFGKQKLKGEDKVKESKKSPLFSIIVPIYKVESYLVQCIESILQQTFQDFELLLIDDGSPDRCPEICDSYQKADIRVNVIHKKNEGLVRARETGLLAAGGRYVGFVDGDDWVEPDWLMKVAKIIHRDCPDMISYNVYLDFVNKTKKQPAMLTPGFYDKALLERNIYPVMLYTPQYKFYNFGVYPSIWSKVIKREIILENRCKNAKITMGEDACCVYASLLDTNSLYVMEDYLYHYRQNPDSMTNAYDEHRFLKYKYLLQYLEENLRDKGYGLKEQLRYHRAFRTKHAILNESKAEGSLCARAIQLKNKMVQYGMEQAFDDLKIERMGIATSLFVYLVRKRRYRALIWMCDVFNWMQKRK
ncbi:MAG: glycosyltransferase family 2 protein [Lachnospiraceae bacterium]|nr:glycosyltransferase family 2 protein [Lachnospiraceae bacterium]